MTLQARTCVSFGKNREKGRKNRKKREILVRKVGKMGKNHVWIYGDLVSIYGSVMCIYAGLVQFTGALCRFTGGLVSLYGERYVDLRGVGVDLRDI